MPTDKTIRLLLLNGPLPPPYGGVSTYLAHALPYLSRNGFEVHTVMDQRPTRPDQYAEFERSGIHIHYGGGSRWQKAFRLMGHLPTWTRLARDAKLPMGPLLRTAASQASWVGAAERLMRTVPIDIIHAYDYPWVQGYVAAGLAKKFGIPYVQTTFGEVVPHESEMEPRDPIGDQYLPLVTQVLSRCDTVIAMSRHCARVLGTVGVPEERVAVMSYGIDTKKFTPANDGQRIRDHFGWGTRPIVLFLGHMRPRKGPQILLEAAPKILAHAHDALIVFAGPDYGMIEGLKKRADELGVQENVRFLGPQPDDQIVGLYAACDIFAFPTCTPIECLGLSMVQALATERPVVGSDINGIPEVIDDGQNGFLVPPSDPAALADKIGILLGDPGLRKDMGGRGRKKVLEVFDQDIVVKELEALYRTLAL